MILSGRGWDRTRTGAEWIVYEAIAPTQDEMGSSS
jgi:phage terminase large subunit-like protein